MKNEKEEIKPLLFLVVCRSYEREREKRIKFENIRREKERERDCLERKKKGVRSGEK